MPVDGHVQRDNVAILGIGNPRSVAPVDNAVSNMKQQIRQRRFPVRMTGEKICQDARNLWPNAGKRGDRGEKRIENRRAHRKLANFHFDRRTGNVGMK